MKRILLIIAMLWGIAACNNAQNVAVQNHESNVRSDGEVLFEVAKNYFFKKGQEIPVSPKITSAEEFSKLFGMATVMGEKGRPTAIDFNKQYVLAIVLPVTELATEIIPVKVEVEGDTLYYTYNVVVGERQSFAIQPLTIIILDKKYENMEVVLSPLGNSVRGLDGSGRADEQA